MGADCSHSLFSCPPVYFSCPPAPSIHICHDSHDVWIAGSVIPAQLWPRGAVPISWCYYIDALGRGNNQKPTQGRQQAPRPTQRAALCTVFYSMLALSPKFVSTQQQEDLSTLQRGGWVVPRRQHFFYNQPDQFMVPIPKPQAPHTG